MLLKSSKYVFSSMRHPSSWQFVLTICQIGIVPLVFDGIEPRDGTEITLAQKRKLGATSFEIPDSEDEDYGWQDDDDNALPRPPPQWQGSEDLILGQEPGADDSGGGTDDSEDDASAARVPFDD